MTGSALPNCHLSQVWTDQHSVSRLGHGSAFLAPFSSLSDARDPRGPVCAPGAVFLRLGRPVAYRARSRPSRHARAVITRIGRFVPLGAGFRTFRPFSSAWPSRWRSHPLAPVGGLGRASVGSRHGRFIARVRWRFHPSRAPGAVFTRFVPFVPRAVPFSPVLCCFAHARCRFHPSRPPVVVCTRLCRLVHLGGRRGTAGPSATPGPVFARLCRSVPLAARPGHLGLPVPFFAVFLSRSHPILLSRSHPP